MRVVSTRSGSARVGPILPGPAYAAGVRLRLALKDLVVASWPADPGAIRATVFPGLEPATIEGRLLVSLVGLRFAGGRLGPIRVPPFAQLNVRTYVRYADEPAVYFLRSYVTPGGLGGALFGVPLRAARMRLRPGHADVPAAGFSLAYRPAEPGEPPELGRHELGLFEAAGLRQFRIAREAAEWRRAEASGTPRADVLRSFGFEPAGAPDVYVATGGSFVVEVPPRKSSSSRSRR